MEQLPVGWKLKKGNHPVVRHTTFQGMEIAIETDKGEVRHWHDPVKNVDGKTKMHYPYGYFKGTKTSGLSGDKMALDVYVGPVDDADDVYVVHQMKRPDFTKFDELKVMVGFESLKQARAAYHMHYNDERFMGEVDSMPIDQFKEKYIAPFVKALAGKDVGIVGDQQSPPAPMPQRMPGMPGMGPGAFMPMMQMGPPPLDVETFEGVKSALGRVGNMKDTELINLAEEIWGPGYEFVNATPEHVRCEILGFLLDQRDLLEQATDPIYQGISPAQMSMLSSPQSMPGQPGMGAPPNAANFSSAASPPATSTDSSGTGSSLSPAQTSPVSTPSKTESLQS